MDFLGASRAATQLMTGAGGVALQYAAPMIPVKAKWLTQIRGSYNLLYPNIHIDFPTRIEIMQYVQERISSSFTLHNLINMHYGLGSKTGTDAPIPQIPVLPIKNEKLYNKFGEKVLTKNDPIFMNIGYGI